MTIWQYIILTGAIVILSLNCLVLVIMWRSLATKSYQQYIQQRYDQQGRQHDEQMRRIREEIDRNHD
jgi:3-deoxy-D-manno-octulosonic-acid transferase